MVRVLVGFIIGVTVGVAAALLMAPFSGEDLRQQVIEHANADVQRMREEYRRGMDDLQARMDKMSTDFTAKMEAEAALDSVADVT